MPAVRRPPGWTTVRAPGRTVVTQPILATDRLRLRPRMPADLEPCFLMNSEPGTVDHIDFPRGGSWQDDASHRAFLSETLAHRYPPGLGYWVIEPLQTPDQFLGWVIMAPEDLTGPEIEIGWRLTSSARGKGYATEAARAMLAHGFGTLGLKAVIADMYRANAGSMGVARKLGMRERIDPPGSDKKHVLWELTHAMWSAPQP